MHIGKVSLLFTTVASKCDTHSSLVLAEISNFMARHCLTKSALENKLLHQSCLSLYNFSKKIPHPLIPVIVYMGSMPFRFYWATLYKDLAFNMEYNVYITFEGCERAVCVVSCIQTQVISHAWLIT